MNKIRFLQYFRKISKINLILIFILCYVVFYFIIGQRGIIAYYQTSRDISLLQSLNKTLVQHVSQIQKEIFLLRPNHVNRDYLEELANQQLGLFPKGYVRIVARSKGIHKE